MDRIVKNFLALPLALLAAASAAAREESSGTWNLVIENDSFTGTDQNYTSGVLLSYLSARDELPGWLRTAAGVLPGIDPGAGLRAGFQFGHSIFTPENIEATEFLPDRRPYAGLLYGGVAVLAGNDDGLDTWLLNLGVIGPGARGESLQNGVHDLIGSPQARGWDNQLDEGFAAALVYEHRWRNLWESEFSGYGIDLNPHAGFSLGNIGTYANLGLTLRIGNDLGNDFGPPRIRPSLPGSGYFAPRDSFAWYLFAGVDARAIGYNALLEGDPLAGELEIDPKPVVTDVQAGLVVIFDRLRLTYTYVYREEEFDQQDGPDRFGSLSLSLKF